LIFSQSHLLWARSIPLSRLELKFVRLVPRRSTRIVLIDDDDGLVERAAQILARGKYTNLHCLRGGIAAWKAAGYELFSGVNVPSKAFGEHVEHACKTPSMTAEQLNHLMKGRADMVVLDSRPFDEFQRVSIPTATNVPGAELVLRVHDLAPSAATTVVVNCAGRTRSIIGAQALRNAGFGNRIMSLKDGTMAWHLAGFEVVKAATLSIIRRSFETSVRANTRNTLLASYQFMKSRNWEFNLASIDPSYPKSPSIGFDSAYMQQLFDYGYQRGRSGILWQTTPAGMEEAPRSTMAGR